MIKFASMWLEHVGMAKALNLPRVSIWRSGGGVSFDVPIEKYKRKSNCLQWLHRQRYPRLACRKEGYIEPFKGVDRRC